MAPTKPRTLMKSGLKNILMDVRRLYTDRTITKMPTTIIAKEKPLPTIPVSLKTSKASVPVVSLKIGALFGI